MDKDLSNEIVQHIKKDGVQFIQFKKLLLYKEKINHAYSLGLDADFRTTKVKKEDRDWKKITENEYKNAIKSYQKILNNYSAEKSNYINIVKPNLKHTNNIVIVKQKINKEKPDFDLEIYKETDSLITNKKKLILSTTNADCLIFLLYDKKNNVIANIHSGWMGTLKRISVKTVEKMIKEYNSNPEDIICAICPSIRKCHFEVRDDVKIPYELEFKNELENLSKEDYQKIISQNKEDNTKWNIDTVEINKIILRNIGIKEENILDSGICSVCNSDLIHSYRVEKEGYKLNTGLIELR